MRSSCCVSSGGRGPQCRVASAGTAAPVGRPAILMLPCRPLSTPADPHRSEPALEAPMAALDVVLVPALSDNYVYLLPASHPRATAVVDPGEAAPVAADLAARAWTLSQNANTPPPHTHL